MLSFLTTFASPCLMISSNDTNGLNSFWGAGSGVGTYPIPSSSLSNMLSGLLLISLSLIRGVLLISSKGVWFSILGAKLEQAVGLRLTTLSLIFKSREEEENTEEELRNLVANLAIGDFIEDFDQMSGMVMARQCSRQS